MRLSLPAATNTSTTYTAAKATGDILTFDAMARQFESVRDIRSTPEDIVCHALTIGDSGTVFAHIDWLQENMTHEHVVIALQRSIAGGNMQLVHELMEAGLFTPETMHARLTEDDKARIQKAREKNLYQHQNSTNGFDGWRFVLNHKISEVHSTTEAAAILVHHHTLVAIAADSPLAEMLLKAGFALYTPNRGWLANLQHMKTENSLGVANFWRRVHGAYPPAALTKADLSEANLSEVHKIQIMIDSSPPFTYHSSEYALVLQILFGTAQRTLLYWQRWGKKEPRSFPNIVTTIAQHKTLALSVLAHPSPVLWRHLGDALLKHGPVILNDPSVEEKYGPWPAAHPERGPHFVARLKEGLAKN